MDRFRIAGGALTVGGIAGYLLGVAAPYPGRSFSLTAVMIGVTVLAIRPPFAWSHASEASVTSAGDRDERSESSGLAGSDRP
jgi:hypothetical protein